MLIAHSLMVVLGLLAATGSHATSLPDSYPMAPAEIKPIPIDPALSAWLEEHLEKPMAILLDEARFRALLATQDPLTRHFLETARATHQGKRELALQHARATLAYLEEVKRSPAKDEALSHPLLPIALEEVMKVRDVPAEISALARADLGRHGAGSCAQKDILYDDMTPEYLKNLSTQELLQIVANIDQFKSVNFRRQILRKFTSGLPEHKREAVAEALVLAFANYPSLIGQVDWLRNAAKKAATTGGKSKDKLPPRSPFLEPYASIAEAKELAGKKKQCSEAQAELTKALTPGLDQESLEPAINAGKAIDGCFRARDKLARRKFWEAMQEPLTKAYGYAGWAEARLRIGYIYWVADDFDAARPIFEEVRQKSVAAKDKVYESKAVFSLGRVAEDEKDPSKASQWYKEFVTRFDGLENYEDALMALVMLQFEKRQFAEAWQALDRYIQAQSSLPLDERSIGGMSFGLFWAGRVKMEQNDKATAAELWRRAANEYYSTYYGALSHYMLEKIAGRPLALAPARAPAFRIAALRQSFTPVDRQRVRRIEMLMHLGLTEVAGCELDELATDDNKPEKVLIKAMMLHASGRWLDAIKAYDSLPRSFRMSLPSGFERIIFPRRHVDVINQYAKKAGIDPDLVMALIRQESVFNPIARSPVGALGLMQLMPQTAKMEAARIGTDYVNAEERKQLTVKSVDPLRLVEPETNVAIGIHHMRSLIRKYQNLVIVLSAYNASPSAAQRWMNEFSLHDELMFIERIPYKETRSYVKLILRNYFYYKRWYGPPTNDLVHLDHVTAILIAANRDKTEKSGVGAQP